MGQKERLSIQGTKTLEITAFILPPVHVRSSVLTIKIQG